MRSLLILGAAALSFALAQTSVIPAIGDLIKIFHTDAAGVAWTLTGPARRPPSTRWGGQWGRRWARR
jgi:hypothetical protein